MSALPAPALAPGDVVFERSSTVTRDRLIRYAGASGDFNPIHYSDRVAAAVGLPGVIAHGMLTMGLAAAAVEAWVAHPDDVAELSVRFSRPVVVPDDDTGVEVRVRGTVRSVDGDHVTLDLTVATGGSTVLTGARARVRPPTPVQDS